jgi:hypothetical protein
MDRRARSNPITIIDLQAERSRLLSVPEEGVKFIERTTRQRLSSAPQ